jgi:chromosomal replication initiator protein
VYDYLVNSYLTPESLDDQTFVLRVTSDQMKPAVSRHLELIQRAVSKVLSRDVKVEICTADELRQKEEPDQKTAAPSGFNPRYTFDRFVVGGNNRFAHAASIAVAEMPGTVYNPLFIYGGSGLGKTHLLHAIGHYVHEHHPDKKLTYITSENFTNDLISAIQQGRNMEFRTRLRNADILMVDDIQFIAGRESTQKEFFNTFNELHNENKQIILTSDKPPKDIQRLEERLSSRFEWGLVADIQRPDVDTRVAILREKTVQENIEVPDEVLQLIAGKIDSNIRELEGCLTRLVAYSTLVKEPITVDLCERALKEIFDSRRHKQITAELIMQTVSDYYGLTMDDLTGPTRKREITVPRQIAMYLTREMTGMSLPQIGNVFGGRDHTTVLHSCKTVEANTTANTDIRAVVEDIKTLVKNAQ